MSAPDSSAGQLYATLAPGDYRCELWLQMFGGPRAPLMGGQPSALVIGDTIKPCYIVNISKFSDEQFACFRAWCAALGHSNSIPSWVSFGYPIDAEGVVVVQIDPKPIAA